jgi:hypothetical protein
VKEVESAELKVDKKRKLNRRERKGRKGKKD